MKQLILFVSSLTLLASCSVQKQASNIQGRTDDVYFTVKDTRIIQKVKEPTALEKQRQKEESLQSQSNVQSNAGNFTSSYANRLRHFGSRNRFNFNNYQPVIVPSIGFNSFTGWNYGIGFGQPMYSFNSPFSPHFGQFMPFNDPFNSFGWGGSWMTGYMPHYTYNPYLYTGFCGGFNQGGFGWNNQFFNPYGGGFYSNFNQFNNNNNWNNNSNNNRSSNTNYSRRTGNSTNVPNSSTTTTQPQNSSTTGGNRNNNGGWWNSGNSSSGSSTSGSSSSSGSKSSGTSSGGSGWWNSGSGSSGSTNSGSGSSSGSSSGNRGGGGSSNSGGGSTRRR